MPARRTASSISTVRATIMWPRANLRARPMRPLRSVGSGADRKRSTSSRCSSGNKGKAVGSEKRATLVIRWATARSSQTNTDVWLSWPGFKCALLVQRVRVACRRTRHSRRVILSCAASAPLRLGLFLSIEHPSPTANAFSLTLPPSPLAQHRKIWRIHQKNCCGHGTVACLL
ncbi:hypothetical protein D3C87_1572240 [compost metagenome]